MMIGWRLGFIRSSCWVLLRQTPTFLDKMSDRHVLFFGMICHAVPSVFACLFLWFFYCSRAKLLLLGSFPQIWFVCFIWPDAANTQRGKFPTMRSQVQILKVSPTPSWDGPLNTKEVGEKHTRNTQTDTLRSQWFGFSQGIDNLWSGNDDWPSLHLRSWEADCLPTNNLPEWKKNYVYLL